MNRVVVEPARDGDVGFVRLAPEPIGQYVEHEMLTAREQVHCAWLRIRADLARQEAAKANASGIAGTASLIRFSEQAAQYEERIKRIHAAARDRRRNLRTSFFKQCVVGAGIVMLIALGFAMWRA